MNRTLFNSHLQNATFRELFITEMGWNNYRGAADLPPILVDDVQYNFRTIAERNGFQILTCIVAEIPTTSLCKKIDIKLRRNAQDYICIYIKNGTTHHQWVAPIKNIEKRDIVSIEYETPAQADFLYSKIDALSFGNTEVTTIVDVKSRIQGTFAVNSEKITKDFYSGFKKEHKAFAEFITGIDDEVNTADNKNKQWYVSVMLNRLMFCYFIQKKGFLDGNVNYLREKLDWTRRERGENRFFSSFYKGFLSYMFANGLNSPEHSDAFKSIYGRIPYLNGGMFDKHQIELDYSDIDISDEAFDRLFTFFDKWRWHLDTRITASGKDINPDVLGYIFEQYINDRAQMGAYYTKEDITEYIGRNCILPFLFDKTAKSQQDAFAPEGFVWSLLKQSGDAYVFDAVKKGYSPDWKDTIPADVAVGLDTQSPNLLERRSAWNNKTPEQWALPTEIWRETIERLSRCESILGKIASGEITSVNDFITYNLDIRNFALDVLDKADYKFVKSFYHALQEITILDPTCGSGAFLFAAMNILEPLYERCIERMQYFAEQGVWKFKEELGEISNKYRSNIQYFIFKSIILRNLYGVDIMAEAVEIAKLRLFLKMVAVVDVDWRAENYGLDPLPDIDFNIRCGNTLVGYANQEELEMSLSQYSDLYEQMANQEFRQQIEDKMLTVALAFDRFKEIQLSLSDDIVTFKNAKNELREQLHELTHLLDLRLFIADTIGQNNPDFGKWFETHQPFHWLAEFYQIIYLNGGFDVIIGNPPYVEYNKKDKETKKAISDLYRIDGYKTEECGNLYAFCMERSHIILTTNGLFGMIVPLSLTCGDRMEKLRSMLEEAYTICFYTNYEIFPSKLFDGAFQRVTIFIGNNNSEGAFVTKLHRWYSIEREVLFSKICYTKADTLYKKNGIAKLYTDTHRKVMEKIYDKSIISRLQTKSPSKKMIYYQEATNYWMKACMRMPYYKKNDVVEKPAHGRFLYFMDDKSWKAVFSLLNSSIFYIYYSAFSDGFHLTDGMVKNFPFKESLLSNSEIVSLADLLENDIKANSFITTRNTQKDKIELESFKLNASKGLLDQIDTCLAETFKFTPVELDFILNYDIKYRMGDELNSEDEE